MKNLFTILFFLGIFSTGFSQMPVKVVEPDEGLNVGALNAAVAADSSTVIYELRRGGIYYINGRISTAWPLHIRAEEGDGPRPILQPAADLNLESDRIFSIGGNHTLDGLYLSGKDDLGNIVKNIQRVGVEDLTITFNDCFFDYDDQCPLRLDASGSKVFITNGTYRNITRVTNPNNGRVVDTRGNQTDTVWIENTTIFHHGDQLFRSGGALVKYFHFDHNTVYVSGEGMDFKGIIKAKVTNNILYNMKWQGSGESEPGFLTNDSLGTISDSLGNVLYTDADRHFDFTNNNVYAEQALIDAVNNNGTLRVYGPFIDESAEFDAMWHFAENGQLDTTNLIREQLTFDNASAAPVDYIGVYHENDGEVKEVVDLPNFYADTDLNLPGESGFTFNYNADAVSATASKTGGPLGSSQWNKSSSVGFDVDEINGSPVLIYPVPAINTLYMRINTEITSQLEIRIFNMSGQVIKSFSFEQGRHAFSLNIGDLESGIYLYRVNSVSGLIDAGKFAVQK